jgi:hypothetical protein
LLAEKLYKEFGKQHVFMDVDAIPMGMDFRNVLEVAVRKADVMLVLIGPTWLTSRSEDGRRLDNPNDFVRMEIEYALRADVPVVPVLIDEAAMPQPGQLPESLRQLAYRLAISLSAASLQADFQGLLQFLRRSLSQLRPSVPGLPSSLSGRAPTAHWKLRLLSWLATLLGVRPAPNERESNNLREETVVQLASTRPTPKTAAGDGEVFMSYARDDTSLMQRVRERLTRSEISVWTDDKLEPGTASWKKAIELAIEKSPCFIILLTPNAKNSSVVEMELGYALAQERIILPILAGGTNRTAVPMEIINRQWTDIREEFEVGMARLIQAVTAYRSGEIPKFN